jgi:hypothetical protein
VLIPVDKDDEDLLPRNAKELSSDEKEIRSLQLAGRGNTNLTGNPEKAHFGKNKFVSTRNLMVTGDLNGDMNSGQQYLNLNLKLPNGRWYTLQLDDFPYADTQEAINVVGAFTDSHIKNIYLRHPKVPQNIKQIIQTL